MTARRPRALIVDDSRNICTLLKRELRGWCVIETAFDGDEAIARIRGGRPYVFVLCDLLMPASPSGYEVLAAVRKHVPDLLPRCIAMTGAPVGAEDAARLAADGVRLIHKPFDLEELRAMVSPFLETPRRRRT